MAALQKSFTSLEEERHDINKSANDWIHDMKDVYELHHEMYLVLKLCVGGDLFDMLGEKPFYHHNEQ